MTPTMVPNPAPRATRMRRVRPFAVVIAALLIAMIGWSAPAGAQPQPKVQLQNLKVLDGDGNPFPGTAGVIYCAGTDPCQSATTNQNGTVNSFFVNPNVEYRVFGFAVDTGWGCGFNFGFGDFYFGASTSGLGRTFARPATFVVKHDCIELHILNAANSQPFPNDSAGLWACPAGNCVFDGPDANVVFAGADANGDVFMRNLLDPAVQYEFNAYAMNIDGCPPIYTSPTGDNFWFAPPLTGTPFAVDGTTFNISDNCT